MMRDDKLIELLDSYTRDEVTKKPDAEHGAPPTQLPEEAYGEYFDLVMNLDGDNEQRRSAALKHAAWMATQAIGFIKEARGLETNAPKLFVKDSHSYVLDVPRAAVSKREKAHRWLGFIQSTLWLCGVYSLDELKEHSHRCSDDYTDADANDDKAAMDADARKSSG